MGRTIITKADILRKNMGAGYKVADAGPADKEIDGYRDKLLKYIPAEVTAYYIAIDALIRSQAGLNVPLYWSVFVFAAILTPLYLWRVAKVEKYVQIIISTIAFVVWVFALGGPFAGLLWYKPFYGALLLASYTALIPIIDPQK